MNSTRAKNWHLMTQKLTKPRSLLMYFMLFPLALFSVLAEDIAAKEAISFDPPTLEWLHAHATATLDKVMILITTIGGEIWFAALVAFLVLGLLSLRRWADATFLITSVAGAAAITLLLKTIFSRARPNLWISLTPESSFSFPSGHATGSTALAAALVVLLWNTRWRVPTLVIGILYSGLVSLSRLYLGVHYPSDVLAGFTTALAWVVLVTLFLRPTLLRK